MTDKQYKALITFLLIIVLAFSFFAFTFWF